MRQKRGFGAAACALCLLTSVACAGSGDVALTAVRTLGLDDGQAYLNRPIDIAWTADGRAFVLNGGDDTVVVLSPGWLHLMSFAGRGEAPGELSRPTMLQIAADQVWVKVPRGIETYDLDGHYEGLIRLPYEISSVYPYANDLIGTSSFADGIGVRFDTEGKVLGHFGPRPPKLRDTKDFARSLSWLMLPGGRDTCTFLDLFDGKAWRVHGLAGEGQPFDLGLGKGEFANEFQFKAVVSDACVDPLGGYFVVHYPESGGPGYLVHVSPDWQQDGRWRFGSGMRPGIIRVSPRGEICLVEEQGSIIHLCARPDLR